MTKFTYYSQPVEELEMYQRLIQYWSVMFDPQFKAKPIDHMNFDADIFPPAITLTEIEKVIKFEPGYASPDGFVELSPLIKNLELVRLNRARPLRRALNQKMINSAGCGAAHGCTNVMSGLLNSIPKLPKKIFPRQHNQPEVILTLPNYTVYLAQISNMNGLVSPRFVRGRRENGFLPVYDQIKMAISPRTVAVVITYPNNPAQSTYDGRLANELKKIVELCQRQGIFLIVDNIYQDELYPQSRKHTEIFSLTDKLDYIIKVFGPSKDTTFFSGYRCGYWIGDPRIQNTYQYYVSSAENTLSTVSMIMFAWDMLFRAKRYSGRKKLTLGDVKLLDTGLFGWGRKFDAHRVYQSVSRLKLYEKYNQRVDRADALMESTNQRVADFIHNSKYFSDYVNQKIGNLFFVKVNPKYFSGDDDDFFHLLLKKGGYGVLPGNVFGLPREKGNVWFRFTLIHDSCASIIKDLRGIEEFLSKNIGKI